MPLDILSLIKNFVFLVSERINIVESVKESYAHFFDNELKPIFTKGTKEKKTDIRSLEHFFKSILQAENSKYSPSNTKALYKAYKENFKKNMNTVEEVNKFIELLKMYMTFYQESKSLAIEFEKGSFIGNKASDSVAYLSMSKLKMYLPLFFVLKKALQDGQLTETEFNRIFSLLDLHNLAIEISPNAKNKDNKAVTALLAHILSDEVSYDSIYKYLIKDESKNFSFPTQATFIQNIHTASIGTNPKLARYVLYRITNHMSDYKDDTSYSK